MKNLLSATVLATAFTFSGVANADTHIEEVWDCTLRDGKTMEEVNAVNAKWVKFINKKVKGGAIDSRSVTPVVGEFGSFFFVDSFPNLGSWADGKEAMQTEEGEKLNAEFDALTECGSNSLYNSTN